MLSAEYPLFVHWLGSALSSFLFPLSSFLVLVLVLSETVLVLERTQMTEPIFDHERLDVYRVAIDRCV